MRLLCPGFLHEPLHVEQPGQQLRLPVERPEQVRHGHPVARPVHHLDRVARREDARLEHPQVGAGPLPRTEPAYPRGVVVAAAAHPLLEVVARRPHRGHLEEDGPDPPALPHLGLVDVDAGGGEVLAELAVAELVAELPGPPVQLLTGEGVDRLVRAAVVPSVGDLVTGHSQPVHLDRAGDRRLVDRRPPDLGPRRVARHPDVDRPQHALAHGSMIPAPATRFQSCTALQIATHLVSHSRSGSSGWSSSSQTML